MGFPDPLSGTLNCLLAVLWVCWIVPLGTIAAAPFGRLAQLYADGQPSQENPAPDTKATLDPQRDETEGKSSASKISDGAACGALDAAAIKHGVPTDFFWRLIRQESNFDPKAISHVGAMGIAQFMPGTARWRGLADPFEPGQALNESARWLSELRDQFGNFGLAAAAYNAGPQRVKDWIAGRGRLPHETRAYVHNVTGRSAEEWLQPSLGERRQFDEPIGQCTADGRTSEARLESYKDAARVIPSGWGLQLIGDESKARALAEYAQLQKRFHFVLSDRAPILVKRFMGGRGSQTWFFVKVAESSREKAVQLCSKLKSAGGSCLVTPN